MPTFQAMVRRGIWLSIFDSSFEVRWRNCQISRFERFEAMRKNRVIQGLEFDYGRRSYGHACRLAGALRWRREGAGRREEEKANAILPLPARRARRQSTDVTQCEQARGNGPLFLLPSSSVRDLLLSLERKGEEGEAREIDIDMNHMIAIIGTYFFSKETSQTHTFSCNFPIPVELQAV